MHYRHLKNLLVGKHPVAESNMNLSFQQKVIPLNTPTEIELAPGRTIQVTLLDVGISIGSSVVLWLTYYRQTTALGP